MRFSRRQRNRWFFFRYDQLLLEGFSTEEAALIANTKISSPAIRRVRRERKRKLQRIIDRNMEEGMDDFEAVSEAKEELRERLESLGDDITDWDTFKRILYPKGFE